MSRPVRSCQCARCQFDAPHRDREYHRQMNLLLSRLDEQQRRWYLAVESQRLGPGADRLLFDGVLDPDGGTLRPDLSRPGMGLELKRPDAERYRKES